MSAESSSSSTVDRPLPYTMRLRDGRTLFVEVPAHLIRRDRDGEIGFTPAGMRFLDRLRAMAEQVEPDLTSGHIAALRHALRLTQEQLGRQTGVSRLTVSRWERGQIRPGPRSLQALRHLRKQAARQGLLLSA